RVGIPFDIGDRNQPHFDLKIRFTFVGYVFYKAPTSLAFQSRSDGIAQVRRLLEPFNNRSIVAHQCYNVRGGGFLAGSQLFVLTPATTNADIPVDSAVDNVQQIES